MMSLAMPVTRTALCCMALCLAGCSTSPEQKAPPEPEPAPVQPEPTEILVQTVPEDATVSLVGSESSLQPGTIVLVEPGSMRVRVEAPDYFTKTLAITAKEGERTTRTVALEPAVSLRVQTDPESADLYVNGDVVDGAPFEKRMAPGTVVLRAEREGFQPKTQRVELKQGEAQVIALKLSPIPTSADLTIGSTPYSAEVRIDGEYKGTTPLALEALPFGAHEVVLEQSLSEWRRRRAVRQLTFSESSPKALEIDLGAVEYLYGGEWLQRDQFVAREGRAYESAKVANPTQFLVKLDQGEINALRSSEQLAQILHLSMLVGEQLVLKGPEQEWRLLKRAAKPSPAFNEAVGRFLAGGEPLTLPSPGQSAPRSQQIDLSSSQPLLHIVRSIVTSRNQVPALQFDRRYPEGPSETVHLEAADYPVFVTYEGGDGVRIQGAQTARVGGLTLARVESGGHLEIDWQQRPDTLTVWPRRALPGLDPALEAGALRRGEKRLVQLVTGYPVTRLRRITLPADEAEPSERTLGADGPFAKELNLQSGEVGPHEKAGTYTRSWVMHLEVDPGVTQRQLSATYTVGQDQYDPESDLFLRGQHDD